MHFGNEVWKVYDVTVEGVSLVTNYRDTFASQIRNNGLDAVIADLQQRNNPSAPTLMGMATAERDGETLSLRGELNFDSVAELLDSTKPLFATDPPSPS